MDITKEELIKKAREAKLRSYSPYSSFCVGAALLCDDGSVYIGTNVENISYGATCCAERTAFFSAIADGNSSFLAIAITADKTPCYPCGICRQVMAEFCDKDFKIYLDDGNSFVEKSLGELLTDSFDF